MIMRRCDKSFAGRRWQVLCVIAVLFGSLLVGSIIHTALKAACTTRLTKSLITIKTSADSWSALESEAIHRVSECCKDLSHVYRKMCCAGLLCRLHRRALRRNHSRIKTRSYQSSKTRTLRTALRCVRERDISPSTSG